MDGWRAGQTEVMEHFIENRLDGIEHELLVRSGEVWPVLAEMISERTVDLVVIGTHGRSGVRKIVLGSVAESIFRRCPCPVLTVGPNIRGQDPRLGPQRILAPTGFAPQSVRAVQYATLLARDLQSSLALLHVVTDEAEPAAAVDTKEREARLRALIPHDVSLMSQPHFFVESGSVSEKILSTASDWHANLIVLGLRHIDERSRGESTWAKAYEIVRRAICPVMTIRLPE
jgi:nucleotide-binding universal stress UspA family protein